MDISTMHPCKSDATSEAIAVVLLSRGVRVRVPYSEHYGIYITLSLNAPRQVWEGDAGEEGAAYAERLLDCAHHLSVLRDHVPEAVFGSGLEAARSVLLLSALNEYVPEEEEEEGEGATA